jgi:hypothetical protein
VRARGDRLGEAGSSSPNDDVCFVRRIVDGHLVRAFCALE